MNSLDSVNEAVPSPAASDGIFEEVRAEFLAALAMKWPQGHPRREAHFLARELALAAASYADYVGYALCFFNEVPNLMAPESASERYKREGAPSPSWPWDESQFAAESPRKDLLRAASMLMAAVVVMDSLGDVPSLEEMRNWRPR